jgi:hypothetical protein
MAEARGHRVSRLGCPQEVTRVQRINTRGGQAEGACEKAGQLHNAPYSAGYVFLRKGA